MMETDQRNEIIEAVNKSGYYCYYIVTTSYNTDIFHIYDESSELRLKCELSSRFPYEFPKMYLFKEFASKLQPVPHLTAYHFICTFDSNKAFPNFDDTTGVVVESIKKAYDIILDGINKKNEEDFVEEFNSYWDTKGMAEFLLLYHPGDIAKVLYLYHDGHKNPFIISDSKDKLETYINNLTDYQYDKQKIDHCLYIPFHKNLKPPYPNTNEECFRMVRVSSDFFADYESFLNDRRKPSAIIFSQPYESGKILAGWIHSPFTRQKGFRKGKISSKLACLAIDKNEVIWRGDVDVISNQRLFLRGGDGLVNLDQKVSICGCGSIGSYLIEILSELSLNHFTLVDNDILTYDNIARHFCGAEYVGQKKVKAVQGKLIKHYADIDCTPRDEDIIDIVQDNPDFFNGFDYNFLVVGNTPVEIAMLRKYKSGEIQKPIILMWVEPFLLGGHAIILTKNCDIESYLFDDLFAFKYSVLEKGADFSKKEAGCQSTFIPYSGFEAKKFLYDFCDYFHNNVIGKDCGNVLFSWGGKLSWARREGIDLSPSWITKKDRTFIVKELPC